MKVRYPQHTHILVGGAGFIGYNLITHFLEQTDSIIICVDNLSRGRLAHIQKFSDKRKFTFVKADASNYNDLCSALDSLSFNPEHATIWHLAANSDIPAGIDNIDVDFRDTFKSTVCLLKYMKAKLIRNLFFASSSAIYGDHGSTTLVENMGNCLPISNYGAMKLASEACISAAAENFLEKAVIFRFPNVVGTPATHGVIYDFINKISLTPTHFKVLGNGTQQKIYLHIHDLISAMTYLYDNLNSQKQSQIYNIGPADDGVSVKKIAEITANLHNPAPRIEFGSDDRGWVGDIPQFRYSTAKLAKLGWKPKMSSHQAVSRAAKEIYAQRLEGNNEN